MSLYNVPSELVKTKTNQILDKLYGRTYLCDAPQLRKLLKFYKI